MRRRRTDVEPSNGAFAFCLQPEEAFMRCEGPDRQRPEVEVPPRAPSTVVEGLRGPLEQQRKRGYSRCVTARSVAIPGVAVPFLDLTPSTQAVQRPVLEELEAVSDANAFING